MSDEFLKHLRTISFALVLASAGLLLAGSLPRSDVTEQAYLSAASIRDAAQFMTRNWYNKALSPLGWNAFGETRDPEDERELRSFAFSVQANNEHVELSVALLDISPLHAYLTEPFPILSDDSTASFPHTLAEFRANWDSLYARSTVQHVLSPQWPTADAFFVQPAASNPKVVIGSAPRDTRGLAESYGTVSSFLDVGAETRWAMRIYSDSYHRSRSKKWSPYDVGSGDKRPNEERYPLVGEKVSRELRIESVLVSLSEEGAPINFLAELARTSSQPWRLQRFDEAFRELAQEAKGLETITLEQLEAYLGTKRLTAGERVELLGLKIPVASIGTWGLLILLAVQIYALLHFREFLRTHDDRQPHPFPWIGLYSDAFARAVFLVSIGALPAVASIYLAANTRFDPGLERLLIAVLAAINVVVALLTSLVHIRNWRGTRRTD